MLKSSAALPELRHHACKDREQFVGFPQQGVNIFTSEAAILTEQFQPERGFIRLLQ